jgi:hypothetical protein
LRFSEGIKKTALDGANEIDALRMILAAVDVIGTVPSPRSQNASISYATDTANARDYLAVGFVLNPLPSVTRDMRVKRLVIDSTEVVIWVSSPAAAGRDFVRLRAISIRHTYLDSPCFKCPSN